MVSRPSALGGTRRHRSHTPEARGPAPSLVGRAIPARPEPGRRYASAPSFRTARHAPRSGSAPGRARGGRTLVRTRVAIARPSPSSGRAVGRRCSVKLTSARGGIRHAPGRFAPGNRYAPSNNPVSTHALTADALRPNRSASCATLRSGAAGGERSSAANSLKHSATSAVASRHRASTTASRARASVMAAPPPSGRAC